MQLLNVQAVQQDIQEMDVLLVQQITTSLHLNALPAQLWEFIVLNAPHLRSALHVQLDIPEQLAPDVLQAMAETTAPHAPLVSIHQGNYAFHAAI